MNLQSHQQSRGAPTTSLHTISLSGWLPTYVHIMCADLPLGLLQLKNTSRERCAHWFLWSTQTSWGRHSHRSCRISKRNPLCALCTTTCTWECMHVRSVLGTSTDFCVTYNSDIQPNTQIQQQNTYTSGGIWNSFTTRYQLTCFPLTKPNPQNNINVPVCRFLSPITYFLHFSYYVYGRYHTP